MKKFARMSVVTVLACLFWVACSKNPEGIRSEQASLAMPDLNGPAAERKASAETITERKIIRNGDIRFQTSDLEGTYKQVAAKVTELSGYISSDNTSKSENQTEFNLVVRVPEKNFDKLLSGVSELADHIDHRSVNANDVTEEFIDVEARIKTKKQLEERYLQLLSKAEKVPDVLAIERELGTLRADIESMEGRLKYLQDQVSFSTLTINFYEKSVVSSGFWYRVAQALGQGWTNFLSAFVFVSYLWPFLILLVVVFYFFRRRRRKAGA